MVIRTKIVTTVGPASAGAENIRQLVEAGCDVFRINFSHGTEEQHGEFLRDIRSVEAELGEPLAVMGDLCGPKIRVGPIAAGSVLLAEGQELAIQPDPIEGGPERISITLREMMDAAAPGEGILIDDGKIRLEVVEPRRKELLCRVVRGGVLASGKGVNLPHTQLSLSALTEKDRRDAAWIAERGFDYVALSFVRSAGDVEALREVLCEGGCEAHIVAKIEKPQALEHIEAIVEAADAVMVARGDLGVEMDLPAVPVAQKRIAHLCQTAGKPCIIATQMLESMNVSDTPTRAEVSDVANAVLDHADAVMLSGETAVGKHPVAATRAMNDIVSHIQAYHDETYQPARVAYAPARTAAALAAAVRKIIAEDEVAAVAVFTLTGETALMFAKHRLPCPILGLSPNEATLRRMCLYYGVESAQAPLVTHTREILPLAAKFAMERGIAQPGEKIVVVSGRPIGRPGVTNTLVVHTVEAP
jgi:pyruvate kinase